MRDKADGVTRFLVWDKAGGVARSASAAFGMGVVPFAASFRLEDPSEGAEATNPSG
jgi:hypothetical protein